MSWFLASVFHWLLKAVYLSIFKLQSFSSSAIRICLGLFSFSWLLKVGYQSFCKFLGFLFLFMIVESQIFSIFMVVGC